MNKKFGTFGGVFTPSILTILGVIMYMRLGWVVGNAGLIGTIIIIGIAHIISVTTGLSISSIATDKKVGAGGVYYVLSRSLGLPIGGAIGMTLFAGTALSIALYLVGFAESFNAYLHLDTSVYGLRIGGTIALICLATIALISTAVAIKTQYFIMAAIALSLVSIFAGSWNFAPEEVPFFGSADSVPLETVFAIFFPAVTGFTAGIAMSGDLADPKKSIPRGTIAAIVIGFIIYISLAIFIAFLINPEVLKTDNNILMKVALFAPAVVAGIWGATLSSALGGVLGGPRILQAMSLDKITPKLFGKGVGKNKEPRNALFITLIIAECGVLIGELDLIARVVSMFYLAAYGFINLSFFLESWASADFSPSFKVKRWVGLLGFVATFTVMFKLDMMAMFAAFIIIGGIYAYLQRKQLALGTGDIWHSVWSSLVLTGLKRMDKSEDAKRNWKPNIILFSGSTETRPHLIEIAKGIAGKVGMISNFHLIENPEAKVLFPKHKQSLQDPVLINHGIFGRQQEVQNVYQGIETIASTYGFSGVEPNTILLGWAKNTKDPLMFAQMTQKLIELDYNVLYLDYDWNKKFGKYQRIDIWWRNLTNNAELTLNIAKFISISPEWRKAKIRLLLINNTNKEGFERKLHQKLDSYRIDASVKVINNFFENRSSFELMKSNSQDADLIIAGIPDIPEGEEKNFVDNTTEMFGILGTTLLVKTSSILGEDDIEPSSELVQDGLSIPDVVTDLVPLFPAIYAETRPICELLTQELENQSIDIAEHEIASFQNIYMALVEECHGMAVLYAIKMSETNSEIDSSEAAQIQKDLLDDYLNKITHFKEEDLPYLEERITKIYQKYTELPLRVLSEIPRKIKIGGRRISLSRILDRYFRTMYQKSLNDIFHRIGFVDYQLNEQIKGALIQSLQCLDLRSDSSIKSSDCLRRVFDELSRYINEQYALIATDIRNAGRVMVNSFLQEVEKSNSVDKKKTDHYAKKDIKHLKQQNAAYGIHWIRNQGLLSSKLSMDLHLRRMNITVDQVGRKINEEIEGAMINATTHRLDEVRKWLDGISIDSTNNPGDLPEINQSLIYDDQKIEDLFLQAEISGQELPEELKLIDPESLNTFAYKQEESVETLTFDAKVTYDLLIHNNLQKPLQKHLLSVYHGCMEILSKMQNDVNQIAQTINLTGQGISRLEVGSLISEARAHVQHLKEELFSVQRDQRAKLYDIIHTANSALNTSSLIDHAVRIFPEGSPVKASRGVRKWIVSANAIADRYTNLVVSRRKLIRSQQTFGSINGKQSLDAHYELKKFVGGLAFDRKIMDELPYYYRQLFTGKASPTVDQLYFREAELEQAYSMLKSSNSDEHAIIVLGEPLSGKSLFSEAVAKNIERNGIVKIQPPLAGSTQVSDLLKILKKQLHSDFANTEVLSEAPRDTVFIFEDLELWWDRSNLEGEVIRFIVDLVNQYRSSYSFILNCNKYAFAIMQNQGLLDALSASRIYLSRFTTEALRILLLEKHHAGGLVFSLKGQHQDEISNKNIRRLMEKYRINSEGIVGIALHQWISNIVAYEEEVVEIDFPRTMSFPQLEDKEWLVILSQFIIHKHLDADKLQRLFGFRDRDRAQVIINQLSADDLIHDIIGNTYKLDPLVTVWIIKRANELSLI